MQPNDPQTPFTPDADVNNAPVLPVEPPQPVPTRQQAYSATPQAAPAPTEQPQPVQAATPPVETQLVQPEGQPIEQPTELPAQEPITWQAIEYVQHDNSPLWYVGFVFIVVLLMAAAIFVQAWTFAVLILVMAVALMVYSHRPPRELSYVWSSKGLYINDQLHPLGEFKSFGVIQDPEHPEQNQLVLIPVKRFRPGLAVFFPSTVGEVLVDAVGAYLPMQDLHLDAFDRIIRKLRI